MYLEIIIVLATILILFVVWLAFHQKSLKQRAYLMKEAINNKDFTFRLSPKGLLPGERAMQQALNELGETIQTNMSQNEVKSWERLMRVLTHEIMNATAPISSISQSMLGRNDVKGTALEEGIKAINTTANHLNAFVDSYRKLTQLQKPVFEKFSFSDFANQLTALYPTVVWKNPEFKNDIIYTDPSMLRQVLINITKNAIEANATAMSVEMEHVAVSDKRHFVDIYISNNGAPIPPEAAPALFVPFFTTKRTGSGIGLSLCRQIMAQLGGEIDLQDIPRTSYITTFRLRLPV